MKAVVLHLLQPLELHGIPGRQYATGRGAVIALRELLAADHAGTLAGKEVVVQASALSPWACSLPAMLVQLRMA